MVVVWHRLVTAVGAVHVAVRWQHQRTPLVVGITGLQGVRHQLRLSVQLTEQLQASRRWSEHDGGTSTRRAVKDNN